MSDLEMLPTGNIKPHRIVRANEVGVRGTVIETYIKEGRCIICASPADREVWIYQKEGQENGNSVDKKNFACSEECAEMVAWRA